jgi:hypothetical protein
MKFLSRSLVCALGLFLIIPAANAALTPGDARVYFSPYPAVPEQVRTDRDVIHWRLAGELFDEGPCLEGVPFPVLAGTTSRSPPSTPAFDVRPDVRRIRGYERFARILCPRAVARIGRDQHHQRYPTPPWPRADGLRTNFRPLPKNPNGTTTWPPIGHTISDNVATEEPNRAS